MRSLSARLQRKVPTTERGRSQRRNTTRDTPFNMTPRGINTLYPTRSRVREDGGVCWSQSSKKEDAFVVCAET